MQNRLQDLFRDPLEPETPDEYWVIETRPDTFIVSREVALEVERRLEDKQDRRPWEDDG